MPTENTKSSPDHLHSHAKHFAFLWEMGCGGERSGAADGVQLVLCCSQMTHSNESVEWMCWMESPWAELFLSRFSLAQPRACVAWGDFPISGCLVADKPVGGRNLIAGPLPLQNCHIKSLRNVVEHWFNVFSSLGGHLRNGLYLGRSCHRFPLLKSPSTITRELVKVSSKYKCAPRTYTCRYFGAGNICWDNDVTFLVGNQTLPPLLLLESTGLRYPWYIWNRSRCNAVPRIWSRSYLSVKLSSLTNWPGSEGDQPFQRGLLTAFSSC